MKNKQQVSKKTPPDKIKEAVERLKKNWPKAQPHDPKDGKFVDAIKVAKKPKEFTVVRVDSPSRKKPSKK